MAEAIEKHIIEFFAKYIYDCSGIVYADHNYYQLERRLSNLKAHYKLESFSELYDFFKKEITPEMHTQLLDLSTNNETSFFRDNHPFTALAEEVIPELAEKKKMVRNLDIWSAASSMGQEPYSILMTLIDDCPQISGWRINLKATDISEEAMRRTQEGVYTKLEVQRGLPIKKLVKFFDKVDGTTYKFKAQHKTGLNVGRFNLFEDIISQESYDIIFIRNVLIYQNVENKQKILENIFHALRPGGFMFLGNGESLIGIEHKFKIRQLKNCTVFVKPDPNVEELAS